MRELDFLAGLGLVGKAQVGGDSVVIRLNKYGKDVVSLVA